MATVERPWVFEEFDGNEGHIGDIVLVGAIDSVLQEADGPLSIQEIATRLGQQGFPVGNANSLQIDVKMTLLSHPEAFIRNMAGWRIRPTLDPRGSRTRRPRPR